MRSSIPKKITCSSLPFPNLIRLIENKPWRQSRLPRLICIKLGRVARVQQLLHSSSAEMLLTISATTALTFRSLAAATAWLAFTLPPSAKIIVTSALGLMP